MDLSTSKRSCVIGEELRGFARKINEFPNKNPIFRINKQGVKLDSHGGAMSECYVNKKIRVTKLSEEEKDNYERQIKIEIEEKYHEKISIFGERDNFIKGSLILCECENSDISEKKVSAFSASHSCGTGIFYGLCAIAYIDKVFSPTKTYSLTT